MVRNLSAPLKPLPKTLNTEYFLWDCASFASIIAAFIYLGNYWARLPWLIALGWAGNLGLVLGIWLVGFLGWYFTMYRWKKYRFIHAIAQFDRYEADDQWIALAEDVFPAPTNPYLVELRQQCIYRGYGLAIVPFEGHVRVLNAPSRLDEFGKNRKVIEWITDSDWYKKVQTATTYKASKGMLPVLRQHVMRPVRYLALNPIKKHVGSTISKPLEYTSTAYTQWMSGRLVQKWIFLTGLLLLTPFFVKVLTYRDSEVDDLSPRRSERGYNPEDLSNDYYLAETSPIPYGKDITGVPKQYPEKNIPRELPPSNANAGIEGEDDTPTISLSGEDDEPAPAPVAQNTKRKATTSKKTIVKTPKLATYSTPDYCTLLRKSSGWILQDNAYSDRNNAKTRSDLIQKNGITAVVVARSCAEKNTSGYIVWVGGIYTEEAKAQSEKRQYEALLRKKKIYTNKLIIRKL
jgi:hypothetical protein